MAFICKHTLILACFLLIFPEVSFARSIGKLNAEENVSSQESAKEGNLLDQILQLLASQVRAQSELFEGDIVAPIDQLKENYGDGVVNYVSKASRLENMDLFEGDIVANAEDIAAVYGPRHSKSATNAEIQKVSRNNKWPDGIVYYEISSDFKSWEKNIILEAMQEYHEKTCIQFRESTDKERLHIVNNEQGCWSSVGKNTDSSLTQRLSLGSGCLYHGIVLHELGHAIGLWHEQSRPDRDRYITIHQENIEPEQASNFDVRQFSDYLGEPYNFGSIMHYKSDAFSTNGLPTISVHNDLLYEREGKPTLGQRESLSDIDVRQINKHYGCYIPESGPGALHIKILEAGPLWVPGRYYACVHVTDSRGNKRQKCTNMDYISTTDPSWDEELVFDPIDPNAVFYFFDVEIKYNLWVYEHVAVEKQTIWVDFKEHYDSFCVTKTLCVPYQYKLVSGN